LTEFHDVECFVRVERTVMRRYIRGFKIDFNSSRNLRSETSLLLIGL